MADDPANLVGPGGRTADEEATYRALAAASPSYDPLAPLPRSVRSMARDTRDPDRPGQLGELSLLEQQVAAGAQPLPEVSHDWSAPGWFQNDWVLPRETGSFTSGFLHAFGET